jgi:hypothetical protein
VRQQEERRLIAPESLSPKPSLGVNAFGIQHKRALCKVAASRSLGSLGGGNRYALRLRALAGLHNERLCLAPRARRCGAQHGDGGGVWAATACAVGRVGESVALCAMGGVGCGLSSWRGGPGRSLALRPSSCPRFLPPLLLCLAARMRSRQGRRAGADRPGQEVREVVVPRLSPLGPGQASTVLACLKGKGLTAPCAAAHALDPAALGAAAARARDAR